jgi:bifunctional oligoribonuclease and PAP phosphatase NrnA
MRKEIRQILEAIRKAKKVLVTSHLDPDGDSIGSQLALATFLEGRGKKVLITNQGILPSKYSFLDPHQKIILHRSAKVLKFKPDLVIVLESPYLERIGWVREAVPAGVPLLNIDHHPDNISYGSINYLDSQAAAVAEMVYDLLLKAGFPISSTIANWLYAAILTDTGRFRYSATTPRSLRICAQLIDLGADARRLTDQIYFNFSQENLKMLGHVLSGLELFKRGKICCLTVDQKSLERFQVSTGDTEGLVDYSLFVNGALVGALFKEVAPNRTKVSLRSQNNLDIAELARKYGGGGHKNAAGFVLDQPLAQAKKIVIGKLKKWI